jgi:two-component system phosphate regulon sensor histidine kinase PhoR
VRSGSTQNILDHQRLDSLINSMADAVLALDSKAKIELYNGAALNLLDTNTIVSGTPVAKLLKLVDKNNQPVDVNQLIIDLTTAFTNRDYRLSYKDGSTINVYISIAPVHIGYKTKGDEGYVILLRDITREKSLEEERDEFISVVSHELRTPITITEGNISNAQFIADHSGNMTVIKQALKEAHEQVVFLASMINDLSTLSRAERGKLDFTVEPINMHELCAALIHDYTADADKKNLKLIEELDPHLGVLFSSKLYVREVLQNFITNALKYTDRGYVAIGAKPYKKGVVCSISDSGIGISKSDQERVYDKFFRSEDFRTRRANGTGLGLYVTMKLARILHAEIELKSQLDKGSTFTIYLPNLR